MFSLLVVLFLLHIFHSNGTVQPINLIKMGPSSNLAISLEVHERTCERNQNRVPIACKHGCGKTYASKEMAGLHERTCKRNQDRIPIGGGIPQQHFQNMPRGSDKTMRLVRSAMQANLRLYRRNLTERTRYEYNM